MFEIKGNKMYITKGDTGRIAVSLKEALSDSWHSIKANDTLTLTVRDAVDGNIKFASVFTATAANAGDRSATLTITSSQSGALSVGQYTCDIQYKCPDGVYTIFPLLDEHSALRMMTGEQKNWKNFWVLPEVTSP